MPSADFVYRFFAALAELELLKKFKAILVGFPKAEFCGQQPPEGKIEYRLNQQNAIKRALNDYHFDLPVVFNMNFGHTDPQLMIPNGGMATLDCNKKSLYLN